MAKRNTNEPKRVGIDGLVEGDRDTPLTWQLQKVKRKWEDWSTEKYGGVKAMMGKQIGGQLPMRGPDILKFIKKWDSDNSSGSVKKALDIMLQLQDGSTKPDDLYTSIQPLQNILGSSLYNQFQSAGAAASASEKAEEAAPEDDIIAELIAAAMECAGDEAVLAAGLLDSNEISKIRSAYNSGGKYESSKMPLKFVECINRLIPVFKATKGTT